MNTDELKEFLDRKVEEYNRPEFIISDPVSVPHRFSQKQDIEIAGFFAATFAWGKRTTIIGKTLQLMNLMGSSPYDFVVHHKEKERRRFEGFCHRTFNDTDLLYFLSFFQWHYRKHNSLEAAFLPKEINPEEEFIEQSLNHFRNYFFSLEDVPVRTKKHVAAPSRKSACKRLNMFLRWMVRDDGKGVDFGIWKKIGMPQLICPLDVHVTRMSEKFGLLQKPKADWEGALSLTRALRCFDPADPAKYDFALFTLGESGKL